MTAPVDVSFPYPPATAHMISVAQAAHSFYPAQTNSVGPAPLSGLNGDGSNSSAEQADRYEMTAWSGNDFDENTTCGDLEDWGGQEFFNACASDYYEGSTNSCFPPTNYNTDPRTEPWHSPEGWEWCSETSETIDSVEYVYSGFPPSTGTNVILGWHRRRVIPQTQTNASCGNICYGIMTESWATPNSAYGEVEPVGNSGSIFEPASNYRFPNNDAPKVGAWVAWAVCEPVFDESRDSAIKNTVQALGFKLSDIKIPKAIADKIQGFRIYHANRTHENRTVLGQNPIHPMGKRRNMDTANCPGRVDPEVTDSSDYLYPAGIPGPRFDETIESEFSFHDFYLLNGQKDISAATHIKTQYLLGTYQFRGNTTFYNDELYPDPTLTGEGASSCISPSVYTAAFLSSEQTSPITGFGSSPKANYVLRDKAKAYVNGNVRFKGKPFGFGGAVQLVGSVTWPVCWELVLRKFAAL